MLGSNDPGQLEYAALMNRSRSVERTGTTTWVTGTAIAAVLMAWAIADNSPGRLLAVVFATAVGFYPMIHARQQMRLIAGYIEEFIESRAGGPQWNTRLGHLQVVPTVNPSNDWIVTVLSNLFVLAAVVFSWVFAGPVDHGEVIAGFVTACGVTFAVHSIAETARVATTNFAAVWRQVSTGPREMDRARTSAAS
jgi:MFS superfamily sulfate permease-like transporter